MLNLLYIRFDRVNLEHDTDKLLLGERLAPVIRNACRHTLVYDDAWDLFLSRGAASYAIAFYKSIHLSQIFKGAVHASGELGNVVGFQDKLEKEGKDEQNAKV